MTLFQFEVWNLVC